MPISENTRLQVKERDRSCRGCGQSAHHIHHIVYKSQGGSDEPENLVWLCNLCHLAAHRGKPADHEALGSLGLEGWELGLVLRTNVATVVSQRRTGADRCCGGCDRLGVGSRCLLWDQEVDWDYVCEEYKRRE